MRRILRDFSDEVTKGVVLLLQKSWGRERRKDVACVFNKKNKLDFVNYKQM